MARMMGVLGRRPVLSALAFWLAHLALSAGGYVAAVMLAVGFMDSGGVVPPLWLSLLLGLVQYGLLQPLAYWLLAASPPLSDWADLARVLGVCALNSALVTAMLAGAWRLVSAVSGRGARP